MACGCVHVCVCVCVCVCVLERMTGENDFDLTVAHHARWSKGTNINHTPYRVRATRTHSSSFSCVCVCVCAPANMTQRAQNKTIWKSPGSGHPWVCCLSKLSNPSIRLVNAAVNPALFNTSSLWMALRFTAVIVVMWVFLKIKHSTAHITQYS